jgi:two-component system response regulator MprA
MQTGSTHEHTTPRILVVDDEPGIVDFLELGLGRQGFAVIGASDGATALALVRETPPDLVVLDVGLPGLDGFAVLAQIRVESDVPVVLLTAHGDVDDRVKGLGLGADDYVTKPFHLEELIARIRAHLRRRSAEPLPESPLRFFDLELDPKAHEVRRQDRPIELTAREFELLELFLRHPGETLSKRKILDRLWGYAFDPNLVEVYVGYLRRKLGEPQLIWTTRGVGYALREPIEPA